MNLALDEALRAVTSDESFRTRARSAPAGTAARAGITEADLAAAIEGDVLHLYDRGAHPLLIMAAAATAGVDAMAAFADGRRSGCQ